MKQERSNRCPSGSASFVKERTRKDLRADEDGNLRMGVDISEKSNQSRCVVRKPTFPNHTETEKEKEMLLWT